MARKKTRLVIREQPQAKKDWRVLWRALQETARVADEMPSDPNDGGLPRLRNGETQSFLSPGWLVATAFKRHWPWDLEPQEVTDRLEQILNTNDSWEIADRMLFGTPVPLEELLTDAGLAWNKIRGHRWDAAADELGQYEFDPTVFRCGYGDGYHRLLGWALNAADRGLFEPDMVKAGLNEERCVPFSQRQIGRVLKMRPNTVSGYIHAAAEQGWLRLVVRAKPPTRAAIYSVAWAEWDQGHAWPVWDE